MTHDKRFIIDDDRKVLFFLNYKTGWSTFEKYVIKADHINTRFFTDPSELKGLSNYRKIFFFREPTERFISYINDKVLLMRGDKKATFRYISKVAPPSFVDTFMSS